MPFRDPNTPGRPPSRSTASAFWGDEAIWDSHANVHNPMFDQRGRLWFTSRESAPDNPAFCKEGSDHPSAKLTPADRSGRQLAVYDPKRKEDDAHRHLLRHAPSAVRRGRQQHAVDQQRRRRRSRRLAEHEDVGRDPRRGEVAGLDSAGSSTPTATASATSTRKPIAPARSRRRIKRRQRRLLRRHAPSGRWIGLGPASGFPGSIVRLSPGSNPPETALAEVYEVPWNNPKRPCRASRRAAWISTATTSYGWRSAAGTSRQLRSPQVQGSAERAHGHRTALSGRLDAVSRRRVRTSRT